MSINGSDIWLSVSSSWIVVTPSVEITPAVVMVVPLVPKPPPNVAPAVQTNEAKVAWPEDPRVVNDPAAAASPPIVTPSTVPLLMSTVVTIPRSVQVPVTVTSAESVIAPPMYTGLL